MKETAADATLPDDARPECPVCFKQLGVTSPGQSESGQSGQSDSDLPINSLWPDDAIGCSNAGHALCMRCAQTLIRTDDTPLDADSYLSYKCPLCRGMTPLSTASLLAVVMGSWKLATERSMEHSSSVSAVFHMSETLPSPPSQSPPSPPSLPSPPTSEIAANLGHGTAGSSTAQDATRRQLVVEAASRWVILGLWLGTIHAESESAPSDNAHRPRWLRSCCSSSS